MGTGYLGGDANTREGSVKNYSLFFDFSEVFRRAHLGVREALRDNQLAGNAIAVWRGGQVVLVPAENINIPGYDPDPLSRHGKGGEGS